MKVIIDKSRMDNRMVFYKYLMEYLAHIKISRLPWNKNVVWGKYTGKSLKLPTHVVSDGKWVEATSDCRGCIGEPCDPTKIKTPATHRGSQTTDMKQRLKGRV